MLFWICVGQQSLLQNTMLPLDRALHKTHDLTASRKGAEGNVLDAWLYRTAALEHQGSDNGGKLLSKAQIGALGEML